MIEALVHPRYGAAVREAAADGVLSEAERQSLEALRSRLRLEPDAAERVRRSTLREVVTSAVSTAMSDHRLSPDDLRSIKSMQENFGVAIDVGQQTQEEMDRFAELWRIENGILPEIEAPIVLKPAERCHHQAVCSWWELRTRTSRVTCHGPTASFRITKEIRYRVGSLALNRLTTEELVHIDSGIAYFTSQRILFEGATRNTSVNLTSLTGFEPYEDAIVLEKANGRKLHFVLHEADLEYTCVLLSALLGRT